MKSDVKILVVEDEEAIRLALEENLRFEGYDVAGAADGTVGLRKARDWRPDLVLLDIMLPGLSGYEVCRKMRESGLQMPVIMLTARGEEFDKLHGFEVGADDYVTKPFSLKELLARVKAVLSRSREITANLPNPEFGQCVLDLGARLLRRKSGDGDWEDIKLTKTEFELLAYLCRNEGKALSRDQLMNDIWGMEYYGTQRSIDSFVATLRQKVEADPHEPKHILTVHGVGYKFEKS